MRRSIFLMPIALGLLPSPARPQTDTAGDCEPVDGKTAFTNYEAGERAIKAGLRVEAGRDFERAARMASNNMGYQARFAEVGAEASRWAASAARLLIPADKMGEARSFIDDALRIDPNNLGAAELLDRI